MRVILWFCFVGTEISSNGIQVGHVIAGLAKPELLHTYSTERQVVAKTLIDFDTKFSKLFSGRPATDMLDEQGISLDEFQNVFRKGEFIRRHDINLRNCI